jgi:ferredoxin-NADP reductase
MSVAAEIRRARLLGLDWLSPTAFCLTLERAGFSFRAGELIGLQGPGRLDARDYTLACGERDEQLRVLVRRIPQGTLTPWLSCRQPGEWLEFTGPYGTFTLRDPARPAVFLATGTGIAPALAFRRSHPRLPLTVLHGVARAEDLFFRAEFDPARYWPCVSREPHAGWQGRVTDRLRELGPTPDAHYYLCGANEMIYEAEDWLIASGVPRASIFHEPYYYRWDA